MASVHRARRAFPAFGPDSFSREQEGHDVTVPFSLLPTAYVPWGVFVLAGDEVGAAFIAGEGFVAGDALVAGEAFIDGDGLGNGDGVGLGAGPFMTGVVAPATNCHCPFRRV